MYVRSKTIKGHRYYYLVEDRRFRGGVKQRVIRYLGKNAGASVIPSGTGTPTSAPLPSPPRVFTVDESPPPVPTDETPEISENPPRKVTWLQRGKLDPLEAEQIDVGMVLQRITRLSRGRFRYRIDEWVVTETRDFGVFKAIPKKAFDKAVRQATRTPWLGGWISAFMVLTGHPPARIILTWFANSDLAEYFTTASLPE